MSSTCGSSAVLLLFVAMMFFSRSSPRWSCAGLRHAHTLIHTTELISDGPVYTSDVQGSWCRDRGLLLQRLRALVLQVASSYPSHLCIFNHAHVLRCGSGGIKRLGSLRSYPRPDPAPSAYQSSKRTNRKCSRHSRPEIMNPHVLWHG